MFSKIKFCKIFQFLLSITRFRNFSHKQTFFTELADSFWRRANAWNVSTRISLRWPIYLQLSTLLKNHTFLTFWSLINPHFFIFFVLPCFFIQRSQRRKGNPQCLLRIFLKLTIKKSNVLKILYPSAPRPVQPRTTDRILPCWGVALHQAQTSSSMNHPT